MVPRSHLQRMITADQLSEQLGGQLQAASLRTMARQGRIAGAVKIGRRVLFDSRSASWLIKDLGVDPSLPPKVWGNGVDS